MADQEGRRSLVERGIAAAVFAVVAVLAIPTGCRTVADSREPQPATEPPGVGSASDRAGQADSAEIARRIAIVMEEAVAEHADAAAVLSKLPLEGEYPPVNLRQVHFMAWSLRDASQPILNRSAAVENFVASQDPRAGAVCARAAARYLDHKQPQYRAVACELLAHYPLETIDEGLLPAIARRLGDSAPAFPGAGIWDGQMESFICRSKRDVCVADVAPDGFGLRHGLLVRGFQDVRRLVAEQCGRASAPLVLGDAMADA